MSMLHVFGLPCMGKKINRTQQLAGSKSLCFGDFETSKNFTPPKNLAFKQGTRVTIVYVQNFGANITNFPPSLKL